MKAGPLRFGAFKVDPSHEAAVTCVQEWTRHHFALDPDATVLVSELVCKRPNCPPLETLVAFWVDVDQRRHFKVFKPVTDVAPSDLPAAWLIDALCAEPGGEGGCC